MENYCSSPGKGFYKYSVPHLRNFFVIQLTDLLTCSNFDLLNEPKTLQKIKKEN